MMEEKEMMKMELPNTRLYGVEEGKKEVKERKKLVFDGDKLVPVKDGEKQPENSTELPKQKLY